MMKTQKSVDNTVKLWGFSLFSSDSDQLLKDLITQVETGKTLEIVVTPNPEQIIQARKSAVLRHLLEEARWILPDGVGIVLASRILTSRVKQPVLIGTLPGRKVVADLLRLSRVHQWKCVVVGGSGYAGKHDQAVLDVHGATVEWLSGYRQVAYPSATEEKVLCQRISAIRPDIVFVAFGAPAQEQWIHDHHELLEKSGVKLVMSVGGSFDTLLGKIPSPPHILSQLGLEWLFRLMIQPKRWRRQLRLISFVLLVGKTWFNPSLNDHLPLD